MSINVTTIYACTFAVAHVSQTDSTYRDVHLAVMVEATYRLN